MKWFITQWKQIRFAWLAYWLRRKYEKKLTDVSNNRWINNSRGLMTREREIVHEWYAKEFNALYQKYCK